MNTEKLIAAGFELKNRIDTWGNTIPQWTMLNGEWRFEVEITRIGPRLSIINRYGKPFASYRNVFFFAKEWETEILDFLKNFS